jgi:hypothetical protein
MIPFDDVKTNIYKWMSSARILSMLREKLGYGIDDKIYLIPKEDSTDKYLYDIFHKRFEETNKKYGDTQIDMEKNETEFFKDNVDRFFDHDMIHEKVALLCRNSKLLLFKKFQNKDNVGLSEQLFRNCWDNEYKCQMFREEVMVLFLERFLIPTLMNNYKKEDKSFDGFNKNTLHEKIIEIGIHLILNLSGSGHHFLRRYAIHHYTQIIMFNLFNIQELVYIALQITDVQIYDKKSDITVNHIKNNVEKFVDEIILNYIHYNKYYNYYVKSNSDLCNLNKELENDIFKNDVVFNKIIKFINGHEKNIYEYDNIYYAPKINLGIYSTHFQNCKLLSNDLDESDSNSDNFDDNSHLDIFKNRFNSVYMIFRIKQVDSNFKKRNTVTLVDGYYKKYEVYPVLASAKISIEFMTNDEINNIFSIRAKQQGFYTYYKSDSCEFGEEDINSFDVGYVNSYGDVPYCFHKLLEETFKKHLHETMSTSHSNN